MHVARVGRSSQGDQRYWAQVRLLLVKNHHYNRSEAIRAVRNYRAVLLLNGLEDAIYHAPHHQTAEGIIRGGYVEESGTIRPKMKTSTKGISTVPQRKTPSKQETQLQARKVK